MTIDERKLFAEHARESAPEGVFVLQDDTQDIPAHDYAIVEVIDEDEHGIVFSYLATGDARGITWAWDHARENHPRPGALKIMDLRKAATQVKTIEMS